METIKVLDDILEKIEGILESPKTSNGDKDFIKRWMEYARETFKLISTTPKTMTKEQFLYYNNKNEELVEKYGKWN